MSENKKLADELLKKAYEENYTSVYRFCLSKLKNDTHSVEDCVQEAFIVLYNKFLNGEKVEYVKAFLFKSADNFIMKKYEDIKKAQKTVDIEDVIEIPSQDEDIDDRLTFEEYSRQISAALSETDAKLFSMRYIEELKIEDIAQRMDMTISNATTRLHRIRKKLKKLFNDEKFKE